MKFYRKRNDSLLRSWLYPVAQMLAEASTSMTHLSIILRGSEAPVFRGVGNPPSPISLMYIRIFSAWRFGNPIQIVMRKLGKGRVVFTTPITLNGVFTPGVSKHARKRYGA